MCVSSQTVLLSIQIITVITLGDNFTFCKLFLFMTDRRKEYTINNI